MRSVSKLEQVAGRCFRADFPHIICFVDNAKISENHWKEAQKWFKSRNGTIYEMISEHAATQMKSKTTDHVGLASAQLAMIRKNESSGSNCVPQIKIVPSTAPQLSVVQANKDHIPNQIQTTSSNLIQAQLARLNLNI